LENLKLDVWAQHINETSDFVEFQVKTFKGNEKMRLDLLGKYNVENFLGAVTCALHLGVPLISIKEIASNVVPSKTSLRKRLGLRGTTIIDDSYSQNPDGVFAAIEYIKKYKGGNKIILMPCLIELGKAAPSFHKSIGRIIGKTFNLAIITTPFCFEEIKIGAMETGLADRKILFLNDPKKILEKVKSYSSPGDVILIEGRISQNIIEGLIVEA
ncbi:MAG: Mur ligase family protein, partial [Candidatus Bathyarchaeota archaeon]|nr:Mur ligase family protein [Candidatus Bathyarchaeota archaeon]